MALNMVLYLKFALTDDKDDIVMVMIAIQDTRYHIRNDEEEGTNGCEGVHIVGIPCVYEDEPGYSADWAPSSQTVLFQLPIGHHLECNAMEVHIGYLAIYVKLL